MWKNQRLKMRATTKIQNSIRKLQNICTDQRRKTPTRPNQTKQALNQNIDKYNHRFS